MRINQGVEWAVHACVLLAPLPRGRGLSLAAIAEYHGLAPSYMAKQMQALSRAGIVHTAKGKTGGYALARDTTAINLWDISRAINGPAPLFRCTEIRQSGPCASPPEECAAACPIAVAFAKAEQCYRDALRAVSLADVLATTASGVSPDRMTGIFGWYSQNATTLPAA